jgi:DNA recombination protein RmuC
MLVALLALEALTLIVLLVLLLRRPQAISSTQEDARLTTLLAADLPAQMTRLDAAFGATERHLRDELATLRTESRDNASSLRAEVLDTVGKLSERMNTGLSEFRADNRTDATALRDAVGNQTDSLAQRFNSFAADTATSELASRDALNARLKALADDQAAQHLQLREAMHQRLDKLNTDNAAKLEEMRQTVDEKLQKTLHDRLTSSFGEVLKSFGEVQKGLGEMNTLSTGVQDLNRLFSNVKSRGGFAEVQLGNMLEQVLAPGQYVKNAHIKKGSQEVVEYAVRFPGAHDEDVLLPIDAKFPREAWERLESAYEAGVPEQIEQARKEVERVVRFEAKKICEKYIHEPVTTPYAIMFLPTESLYAEVLRRDGLQGDLHQSCKVMVAGPSNLYALLSSFQLGFRMINLQKKGNEVWTVLGEAKTEFGKFGGLMDKMEKKVGEVQGTLQDLGTRSRAINRKLRDVSEVDSEAAVTLPMGTLLPMLAAESEE